MYPRPARSFNQVGKFSDSHVVSQLTDRTAALFHLPPEKVCFRMITRNVKDFLLSVAVEDMFQRLFSKITVFLECGGRHQYSFLIVSSFITCRVQIRICHRD